MPLTVKERQSGEVIASGKENDSVRVFEGNWYFQPQDVNMEHLVVTERTYNCPYKGTCFWIDVVAPDGTLGRNVAWVYRDPRPGYEFIKDAIGFYARSTASTQTSRD